MGYKIRLKHNVYGKTLRVNLKYTGLPEIPVDVTGEYQEFPLSAWDGVSGGLDVRKIKIDGVPVSDDDNTYNIRYYKIEDGNGNSSTGGNGSTGGGGSSSGGSVPDHSNEDFAGGESNYFEGDIIYTTGSGDNQTSSTVPGSSSSSTPEPEPDPVLPTDITSQNFNLPVSSSTEDQQPQVAGDIILYSNGGYRVGEPTRGRRGRKAANNTGIPMIEDIMITGLTENVKGIKLNGTDYNFSGNELVLNVDGNYEELSFVSIPAGEFNAASNYEVYVNYDGGTTSTNNVTVSLPFMYDTTKGTLRIYENGKYRYKVDGETDLDKEIVGTLIPDMPQNAHLYLTAPTYKNYEFEERETVIDNGTPVELKYAKLPAYNMYTLGKTTINVKNSSNETLKSIPVEVYKSDVNIQFKMSTITIDRSSNKSFLNQLPYKELYNCITVTDGEGNTVGYNKRLLNFYIGTYKTGCTAYSGNAVSIIKEDSEYNCGWKFNDCTWEKDATDTICVAYGENLDIAQVSIELVDSDSEQIYLRGFKPVSDFKTKTYVEGETYFIGDLIQHVPDDALYTSVPTYKNYSLDADMVESNYLITDIYEHVKPETWEEFYEDQILTLLNAGTFRFHYGWYGNGSTNSDLNKFGGEMTVSVSSNKYTYDMEDGDLVIYPDGTCTSGTIPSSTPLFTPIGRPFHLSLNDVEYHFDGNNPVTIDQYPVPGEYKLEIVYDDYITNFVKLEINDRKFKPTFKVSEIKIDRSDKQSFAWQLEHKNGNLGTYITKSNLITYSLDYINIPNDCKVNKDPKYLYSKIHMKLNDMKDKGPYGYEYQGNAVKVSKLEDSNGQWCFIDCTWKKDKTDTLYMMFGDREYTPGLTIKTYDSTSNICLRGITDTGYNHKFTVGQIYTLRDMFGFYPGDTTSFSLDMSEFDITGYDTSIVKFTMVSDTAPTSWKDFYDNYIHVTTLKRATTTCNVKWKTKDGIGGTYLIYIYGVTDGGKPASASGAVTNPDDGGESGGQSTDTKPTKGPKLSCKWGQGLGAKNYLTSMGKLRLYDNSAYRFIHDENEELKDVIDPTGNIIYTSGGYQDPEVRYLPVDVTITTLKIDNTYNYNESSFSGNENVLRWPNDEVITRKYITIPFDELFTEYGLHSFFMKYRDNYDGKEYSTRAYLHTMFPYNFADGHLRIYDNGYYRIVPYSEVNGGSSSTPRIQGKFFQSFDLSKFDYCTLSSLNGRYHFDNQEQVYELDGDTPVMHGYFDVTPAQFAGNFWAKYIGLSYIGASTYESIIMISPSDSRIRIGFTVDEITLDRSDPNTMAKQLKAQGGETLKDFLTIEVDEDVDYITMDSDDEDVIDSIKDNIYFFIDNYSSGLGTYSGTGISIYDNGELNECNWKKNAADTIGIKYGGFTYNNTLTIRIIQSTDTVYIRRMEVSSYDLCSPSGVGQSQSFIVGHTYNFRNIISFVPEDVVEDDKHFKHFQIVHVAPSWSSLNGTMDFSFTMDGNYFTGSPAKLTPENAPHNWAEFWNWFTFTPTKAGQPRVRYLFRTDIGGGGGYPWVNVKTP